MASWKFPKVMLRGKATPSVQFRVEDSHCAKEMHSLGDYGLDVHKLSNTYTCMNEERRILCRGRVATAPEAIRKIAVPSGGQKPG